MIADSALSEDADVRRVCMMFCVAYVLEGLLARIDGRALADDQPSGAHVVLDDRLGLVLVPITEPLRAKVSEEAGSPIPRFYHLTDGVSTWAADLPSMAALSTFTPSSSEDSGHKRPWAGRPVRSA